jgi:hypothetical protein
VLADTYRLPQTAPTAGDGIPRPSIPLASVRHRRWRTRDTCHLRGSLSHCSIARGSNSAIAAAIPSAVEPKRYPGGPTGSPLPSLRGLSVLGPSVLGLSVCAIASVGRVRTRPPRVPRLLA